MRMQIVALVYACARGRFCCDERRRAHYLALALVGALVVAVAAAAAVVVVVVIVVVVAVVVAVTTVARADCGNAARREYASAAGKNIFQRSSSPSPRRLPSRARDTFSRFLRWRQRAHARCRTMTVKNAAAFSMLDRGRSGVRNAHNWRAWAAMANGGGGDGSGGGGGKVTESNSARVLRQWRRWRRWRRRRRRRRRRHARARAFVRIARITSSIARAHSLQSIADKRRRSRRR